MRERAQAPALDTTLAPPAMIITLTKAQQRTWDLILEAPHQTPDKTYGTPFYLESDWERTTIFPTGPITTSWKGGRVYGAFNTATLKALESKGLIKVHAFGGSQDDEIEVLAA